MKRITLFTALLLAATLSNTNAVAQSKGPMDPMSVDDWTLGISVGPGTHVWGNGHGFGPAIKVTAEKGMWQLGPGVLTLGGEATFSFFSSLYGNGERETWFNFIFAARSAYHYGWEVRGLDTYAGVPLGMGFTAHVHPDTPGYTSTLPVYPYAGFFCGASYFFSRDFGLNAEVGYNSTYATIGVLFKLN